MARELKLFVNADEGKFVAAFDSAVNAILPKFILGDQVPVSVRILTKAASDSSRPWQEADLTGQTIRVAIGNPAGPPTSGTFTLETDEDETATLAFDASAATVQTELNALTSVTLAGGVSVTKAGTGVYRVVYNDPGARDPLTASAASLYPSVDATILTAQEGDAETQQVELIRFETQPAAYVELEDELPSADADVVMIRAGSSGVSEIQSLTLSPEPYDGTYTLTVGGQETAGISYNALPAEIQSALEALSGIGAGKTYVTGSFPRYTIEFDATLEDVGAMVPDVSGLVVPTGRKGVLSTNTTGIVELLNGASQAGAKLEIEIFDTLESTAWTVVQADCTVIDDVIGGAPSSSTDGPTYPTTEGVEAMIAEAIAPLEITCPPDTPQTLAITGTLTNTDTSSITTPVTLLYAGMVGGKAMWSADGTTGATTNYCKWLPDAIPFPKWELKLSTGYTASSATDKGLPSGLTFAASLGSGVPTVTAGAVVQADKIGQLAIATIGSALYSFRCTDTSPMTWEGATPGLLKNSTLEIWRMTTLSGVDGSESMTTTAL